MTPEFSVHFRSCQRYHTLLPWMMNIRAMRYPHRRKSAHDVDVVLAVRKHVAWNIAESQLRLERCTWANTACRHPTHADERIPGEHLRAERYSVSVYSSLAVSPTRSAEPSRRLGGAITQSGFSRGLAACGLTHFRPSISPPSHASVAWCSGTHHWTATSVDAEHKCGRLGTSAGGGLTGARPSATTPSAQPGGQRSSGKSRGSPHGMPRSPPLGGGGQAV